MRTTHGAELCPRPPRTKDGPALGDQEGDGWRLGFCAAVHGQLTRGHLLSVKTVLSVKQGGSPLLTPQGHYEN